ncbi:hypothetical protein V2J09_011133 [Rumex salicifolius]
MRKAVKIEKAGLSINLNSTYYSTSSSSRRARKKSIELNRIEDKTAVPVVWMVGSEEDMNRLLAVLFHQGVLDEQFLQLQQLQDDASPNLEVKVVNIYFHESEKLLRNLRSLLPLSAGDSKQESESGSEETAEYLTSWKCF